MTAPSKILRNVGSNSLGYAVNVLVGLKLGPYVTDKLGKTAFGIWTLVVCFVGYYGLFDVGIRSAVGHYVATYRARRDAIGVNRTLSTAMALLLVVALFAAIVTVIASRFMPSWYEQINAFRVSIGEKEMDLSGALRDPSQLRVVVLVMGIGFALSLPMALFGTVIYATQKIAQQNAIGIAQVLLRAALTVWALEAGHGLIGLACVVVGCNVLGWFATIIAAYRAVPGLSLAFRNSTRASAAELYSYGGFNFLVNVADTVLLFTSGFIIIQVTKDPDSVTYFAIPATQLIPYFMQLVQTVTWALTPHFTGSWATGDVAAVRGLLEKGTRWVTLLAALITGGLLFLGHDFMSIWQKPAIVGGALFPQSVQCLSILAVATLLRAAQSTGRQALFAMREVRYLGLLSLAEAIGNVVLSILLIRRFGLVGMAFGTLLPVIVTQGFVQPNHLLREIGLPLGRHFGDLFRAVIPAIATMGAIHLLLGPRLAVTSLATFLLRGTVVALPAAVIGALATATPDERATFLRRFGHA